MRALCNPVITGNAQDLPLNQRPSLDRLAFFAVSGIGFSGEGMTEEYVISDKDTCEVCGTPGTETKLDWCGHGTMIACAAGCPPRYNEPRERAYAELTTGILDDLEWKADEWDAFILGIEVDPAVLHTLVKVARKSMTEDAKARKDLPSPCDLLKARDWLLSGCPAYPIKQFGERSDPKAAIDILVKLLDALPSHFAQYCYGTPEFREAMIECQESKPEP
jgi:hypothetical protein